MYNHFQYAEMLARQLAAISHTGEDPHFFRASEQGDLIELTQMISRAHDVIMIAVDGQASDFNFNRADSLMSRSGFSLVIAKQTTKSDVETIFTAQKESREIMLQVISRYMKDYHECNHGCDNLDPGSFSFTGIGPIGDQFYGVILDFYVAEGLNYKINPEMWK